jgi:hypothetical protein
MLLIYSTPVLIRHLWQLKTIIFLHWFLICPVLLVATPPKGQRQVQSRLRFCRRQRSNHRSCKRTLLYLVRRQNASPVKPLQSADDGRRRGDGQNGSGVDPLWIVRAAADQDQSVRQNSATQGLKLVPRHSP